MVKVSSLWRKCAGITIKERQGEPVEREMDWRDGEVKGRNERRKAKKNWLKDGKMEGREGWRQAGRQKN